MRAATFVAVLLFLGPATVFPQIPFQALALGADAQLIALLLTADIVVTLFLAPFAGTLSDRFGAKVVVLGGLAFGPASFVLLAYADSLPLMFASRLLMGVSMAVRPALQTYVVANARPEDRTSGLAGINGAFALAFVIGPAIASVWFSVDSGAFNDVALVAGLVSVAAIGAAFATLQHSPVVTPRSGYIAAVHPQSPNPTRNDVTPRLYTLCQAMVAFGFSAMAATIGVWSASALAWDAQDLSIALIAAGMAAVIMQFGPTSFLARRLGNHVVAIGAMVSMLAGFLLLIAASVSVQAALAICLMGAGSAVSLSCLQSMLSAITPPGAQGSVFGTTLSVNSLARILGPLWGGYSLVHVGLSAPHASGAALLIVAIFLLGRAWPMRGEGNIVS